MKIAVLMTCYNRVETTLRCLQSLFSQAIERSSGPNNRTVLDIWLVDDASPDKTGEKVKAAFPQVNVIQSPGGLYWCKGMRLAWDTAAAAKDYDGYLWLNDDVELYPDSIVTLLADRADVGDEAVLVGTTHMRFGDEELSYGPDDEDGRGLVRPNGRPQRVRGVMSGNFVYVPRKVFRAIGPIYGGYSHGYGDRDYALLTDRKGVPRYCCSKVVGVCPQQPERYRHRLKEASIRERFRVLLAPNGFSIRDNFIYKFRNFGVWAALGSAAHIFWIRVVRGYED